MKKNYFLIAAVALLMSVQTLFAQNPGTIDVNQVLVVSGGAFTNPDDYVTVATYKPSDSSTTQFGTVFTQSVQCAVVFDHYLYVAAQDSVVAYDIDTYQRVAAIFAQGVNQLEATEEKLIASFWYPDTADFVRIYNRDDLSELAVISEVSDEAAGIAVYNNKAYVAVPGGWAATSGKLAVVDLETNAFVQEIDLGTEGSGISNVYVYEEGDNQYLITVNKTPWGGSAGYVMKIDLADMSVTSAEVNVNLGKGVDLVNDESILYAMINGGIGSISVSDLTIADTVIVAAPPMSMAGAAFDHVHQQFYVTTTDYASVGNGVIYNMDGDSTGSFEAGISAEAIAIDYRDFEGVEDNEFNSLAFYPNPTRGVVTVSNPDNRKIEKVTVTDLTGRTLLMLNVSGNGAVSVDLSTFHNGIYLISVFGESEIYTSKIVKQ